MTRPLAPTRDDAPDAVARRLTRVFGHAQRDDERDAAFGLDAAAVQRARMHATAVAEADPDRPRYGIDAVDPDEMF